jgi:tetratricopeptide (TPR) repeat protein
MRRAWLLLLPAVIVLGVVAYLRGGVLDLPAAPRGVTVESSGLAGLEDMRRLDAFLRGERAGVEPVTLAGWTPPAYAPRMKEGLAAVADGRVAEGLAAMQEAMQADPQSLVLANAYRMSLFQLKRRYLDEAKSLAPEFPAEYADEPIGFLTRLDEDHPSRETKLHLAMAWVDHMLLFPALEIKAPSSVQAVDLLTGVLEGGHEAYVPALFARGMNHLHRPARLVWPESAKTPRDAAARDIGLCVAIGQKVKVGSSRLQGQLALALGDAYVKAGRYSVARSWWQLAQNLSRDEALQEAVRRRYAWEDEELLDRIEEELDRGRRELDHPMTDLALMWN